MKTCISIGRVCLRCMPVGSLFVNPLGVVPETVVDFLRREGSEELILCMEKLADYPLFRGVENL